jgi:hypothetical protein
MPGFTGLTDDEESDLAAQARRDLLGNDRPDMGGLFADDDVPTVTNLGEVRAGSNLSADDRAVADSARRDLLGSDASTGIRSAFGSAPVAGLADDVPESFSRPVTPLQTPSFDLGQPLQRDRVVATANTPLTPSEPMRRPTLMSGSATADKSLTDPWADTAPMTFDQQVAAAPRASTASHAGAVFGLDDDEGPVAGTGQAVSASGPDQPSAPRPQPFAPPDTSPAPTPNAAPNSMFSATDAEATRLANARKRERNARIAQAIMAGLGGVMGIAGAASGNKGLGAAGVAISGGSRGLNAAQGRSAEVQGDIDRRMAGEQAQQGYNDQQAAATAAGQRQQQQDQRQATMDEANLGLTQARTEDLNAERANSEFEQAALQGNAQGMRAAIRSRIAAVQHEGTRQGWGNLAASGSELDQMTDLDGLRSILDNVARTDIRRGGQGAGGSGGGRSDDTWVADPNHPNGGYMQRGRARSGGGSGSAPNDSAGPSTQVQAPSGAAPAAGRALPTGDERLALLARYRGIDLNSEAGQAWLASTRERLNEGSSHEAEVMRNDIITATERASDGTGLPLQIDRAEWRDLTRRADEHAQQVTRISPVVGVLSGASDAQIAAALHGGPALRRVAGAADLHSSIWRYMNAYYSAMGGANITANELERYRDAFASGSAINDPQAFVRAIRATLQSNVRAAETIMRRATSHPDLVWEQYVRRVLNQRRGGSR